MIVFKLPLVEWVEVPAGMATLADGAGVFRVPAFRMGRTPVTNAQYTAFVKDGGYRNELWWRDLGPAPSGARPSNWREDEAPKVQVCWYEAVAFCRWLANRTGEAVRLPTEAEWQWAAAGPGGWEYAYGSSFDGTKCNTKEAGAGRANRVTEYAWVMSQFGTVDMTGNVWEWCSNRAESPSETDIGEGGTRALRGGSWNNAQQHAKVTFRYHRAVPTRTYTIGFRVMAER